MKVVELMTRAVVSVRAHDSLGAAARLMWDHDCGAVPVLDDADRVVGMLTDRDICMATWSRDRSPWQIQASEAMSRELFHCSPNDTIAAVENLLREKQLRRMPVLDHKGELVGILSLADIARRGNQAALSGPNTDHVTATLASICRPQAHAGKSA